jgi:hypothetical protein
MGMLKHRLGIAKERREVRRVKTRDQGEGSACGSRGDSDRSTESRGVHTAGIQPPEQGSLGQGEEMRFYEKKIRSVEDQSLPVFSVRRTMEAMMVGCQ